MKLKKSDKVTILAGKDAGKTGSISKVLLKEGKVIVLGVNKRNKHQKPRKEGEKGTKIEFDAPMRVSNVMIICPKCSKPTRVEYKIQENGKKSRSCKKCKTTF